MEQSEVAVVAERLEKNSLESDDLDQATSETSDQPSEDPELSLIKHPLQNRWSFWYFKNEKNRDWKLNQKVVTTFDTVEDFWAVFNHIQPASKIQVGCDYSVFKEGIQPMWEDPRNCKGGRWVVNLEKRKRDELDNFWLETVLYSYSYSVLFMQMGAMGYIHIAFYVGVSVCVDGLVLLCLIGEAFDDLGEEICGAVINLRPKGDKLGLWTADASKADANMRIGRTLKARLHIPLDITLGYESHNASAHKSGSTAKNSYHV